MGACEIRVSMDTAIETAAIEPNASALTAVWHWRQPLDIEHAVELHSEAVERMKPGRGTQLVMDLTEAPSIDACGVQILVALAVEALTRGRFFEISQAPYCIRRYLQLAGVGYLLRQD
jgi:anti-anti-sigma regulatory factor